MLNRILTIFSVLVVIVLSLTACNKDNSKSDTANEITQQIETLHGTQLSSPDIKIPIYVNGKMLPDKALISDDFVKLPFVSVFEALGASVSWESDTNATISYNDKTYFLDTVALTISDANAELGAPNLSINSPMFCVYGGTAILYAQDKEVISDSHNLTILFERLGIDVSITYDKENKIVCITQGTQ